MNKVGAGDTLAGSKTASQFEQLLDFYGFLIQATGLVARADDIDKLHDDICRLGVRLDRRLVLAWVGMVEPGSDEVRVVAHAGPAAGYLDDIQILAVAADVRGRGPTGRALREGRCVIVNRFLDDPSTQPWHDKARAFGIAACAALPLRRGGEVCGALVLYANTVDIFQERIATELDVLAQMLSYAIDTAAERAARRQLDARLLESQQAMRAILDAAHQTILMVAPEGEVLAANRMGAERFGLTPEQLVGKNIFALMPPEVAQRRRSRMEEAVRTGLPVEADDERDGRHFRTTFYPVTGEPPRVAVYAEEITARLAAERAAHEAEQRLEIALAGAGESIWQWNLDTGEAYWSPDFYRQLGYADQEFPGRADEWFGHMHPDDREATQNRIRGQMKAGQELFDVTYRFRAKNGEWRWIEGRGKVVRIADDGHPVLMTGTNVDVTAQHLEEERGRRQAERWLALLRLAQTGEYEGEHGEHDFLSRALEEAQRLTRSRVGFLHLVSADQQACELVAWSGAALDDESLGLEAHYPIGEAGIWVNSFHERRGLLINDYAASARSGRSAEDGAVLSRLISVPVIDDDRVSVIAWVGDKAEPYDQDDLEFLQILAADAWRIVRRRRAEADLRDALQVVEASPVVCFRWRAEPGWPVDYVSQNVSRWGWSSADLLAGHPAFAELVHPEDLPRVTAEVAENTAAGMAEYVQQYRLRTAAGRWFWVEDSTRVIRDAHGRALAYEGVISDIDANKRQAQSLAESLETQRALNRKLQEAQHQLLQSEKLASIGQLAAGVAHEINNPIGFVNSNIGTLAGYLKDIFAVLDICEATANDAAHPEEFAPIRAATADKELDYLRGDTLQLLAESKEGLERVRKIVQDLKDFSRVGEAHWQWADIHHGIDSTLNIVWNELKYKCTVTKHYGELPRVYCLPSQLNQVFMNLLVNAAQAIEERGEITIATECVGTSAVRIRFTDTGPGIAPEHINRVFEPFFTTKPVGQGTGLGLSLAWGIVQRHRGSIEVDSQPGKGTIFTITLPIKPPPEAEGNTVPPTPTFETS